MRPQLRALASRQGGLITRRQALGAGYSEKEIRTLTRPDAEWVIVRRGVYAERALTESLNRYDGPMQLLDRAAHLMMVMPHLLSHDSAARALGVPMLRPVDELVHITRFGVGGSRTEEGVKHHLTQLGLLDTDVVDGMRVTGLARTALDLAREHGAETGVVACDHVIRRGVTKLDLAAELVPMWCWPNITQSRAAVELADPGAETPGESLARMFVIELEIGVPVTQFPVLVGRQVFWTDLLVGCHVIEFDGFKKFQRRDLGGVADKPAEEVAWDEKRRQDLVCGEGLGMSRLVWSDFFGRARIQAMERVRHEYAVTASRFGTALPEHLARFAAAQAAARVARMRIDVDVARRSTYRRL